MSNFILSYDLNGPNPTHHEMDKHLEKIGAARGRILETVWYVGFNGTASDLLNHVRTILNNDDLLVVVKAESINWTKMLVTDDSLKQAWANNQ